MHRRDLLSATLLSAAIPFVGAGSARADTAAMNTENLGPATMAATTLSGGFVGEHAFIVSHLLLPARLGIFDVATATTVHLEELPTGGGAWATVTDGNTIYIGTHTVADLYSFDATTRTLRHHHRIPGATYIWDMCQTADGMIYAGSYPDGKVWEFDPRTGGLQDFGVVVPGETYTRSIIADETTVYAGLGSHARLVAIDRVSRSKRDITPPEFLGESFVYQLTQTDTHIIAGTHGTGLIAMISKADPTDYRIVHPENVVTIGKMAVLGSTVYFGAGDALWSLDLNSGVTTKLGIPAAGDFVTALRIHGGAVVVFTNSATMWSYDPASGSMTGFDFQAAGMPPAPELPQSIACHAGHRVYVAGHGGVEVHDLMQPGRRSRIRVSGEAKAMTTVGRDLYLAMYPSATIVRYDPVTGKTAQVAAIGNEQNRPGDMVYEPRRRSLLVASSPDYGRIGGALSIHDTRTGRMNVYRNLVEGQPLVSVAVHSGLGLAYVGSEKPTGSTSPAAIAVFDLDRRRKTVEFVPISGAAAIPHLVVLNDILYGTTSTGTLFAADARTGEVLRTATVATRRVDLIVADGILYGVSHQRLFRIAPGDLTLEVVVNGLATDAASFPMLAHDADNADLFTIAQRDLLRVNI